MGEELRALAQKRARGEICAAHDLSPFFESILGISWDGEKKKALSLQHQMTKTEISAEVVKLRKLVHKKIEETIHRYFRKKEERRWTWRQF